MRIYINCAAEDLEAARQLAYLVLEQRAYRSDPDHSITVEAPADAAAAKQLIDQNPLVVFLLSPEAVRAPWLAEAMEYAASSTSQRAARLIVVATLRPYTADARLETALRDTYVIEGGLRNLAIQIAYYATFRFVQTGGAMGFRPTTPPPDLEPEPADSGGAPLEDRRDEEKSSDAPSAPPSAPPAEEDAPPSWHAGEGSDWGWPSYRDASRASERASATRATAARAAIWSGGWFARFARVRAGWSAHHVTCPVSQVGAAGPAERGVPAKR